MKVLDDNGQERDFFFEVSKYAGFLYRSAVERHLAIYELYKKVHTLPGSVAEFGVFNGSTYFFLARLIEIFNRTGFEKNQDCSHHLYGFDTFEGIIELTEEDETPLPASQRKVGGFSRNAQVFFEDLEWFKRENTTIAPRLHTITGDVCDTFPKFLVDNPGVRFNFVLLDMDIYQPTQVVLDLIMDYVVPGAVLVFDEYGFPNWPGETKAVDQFIRQHHLRLNSFPWAFAPAAYTIVEGNYTYPDTMERIK